MNNEFKIGDIVQITNTGGNYTCFVRMAEYMQLSNFKRAEICPIYTDLKIVAVQGHDEYVGEIVYGVRDIATGKEYLVGDDFMVLVEPSSQYTLDDLRNKYVRVGTPEYEVFMDTCKQTNHAEVNAIKLAGDKAVGGVIYLKGHTYVCDSCKSAAFDAGVESIVIL